MAQLSKVIGSILRDIVFAQHEANMYAIALAESYKQSGNANNFPLPCVALGEMDLEIKYGVIDDSQSHKQFDIDYPKLDKFIIKLSRELSEVIIATMVSSVISSIPDDAVRADDDLIVKLDQEGELKQQFTTFLSHKLQLEFKQDINLLIDANGKFISETIIDKAVAVGCDVVLYHQDLNSYFDFVNGETIRQKAGDSLKATITTIALHLIKDVNVMKCELYQSLNVEIRSEDLAKYPKESVHSLCFKIMPGEVRLDSDNNKIYNNKR